jgi:N-acyl-D-amino-acid deacylase
MSEDNVEKQIAQFWLSFGSDAASTSPEGVFLKSSTHPRAYRNFARLLGHYVREKKVISLAEAIRRLTLLPATNLGLARRGALKPGYFCDVVVFDPAASADHSTYAKPQQYATGMVYVLVNGVVVLKDGEHTGEKPARIARGGGDRRRTGAAIGGRRDHSLSTRWRPALNPRQYHSFGKGTGCLRRARSQ